MQLLREIPTKKRPKAKAKHIPQKQRNYPVPVYKDGVYNVVKYRGKDGKTYFATFKENEDASVLSGRVSLRETIADINRLKQRDKVGIARLLLNDKRDEWKLKYNPKDLLKSKEEVQGYDLDYEVRGLVKDLNEVGLRTEGSCAGHNKGSEGFVGLTKQHLSDDDIRVIKKIADRYHLKEVVIKDAYTDEKGVLMPMSTITFSPIGLGSGE